MRILWIKTELLHPIDKGGKIRTYQMLKELKRKHHVTYLTLHDGLAAHDAIEKAAEYCQDLVTIPHRTSTKFSAAFYLELASNFFSTLPYAISKYTSREMREQIASLTSANKFDIVVCDFLAPAANVPAELPCVSLLFQHNVEAMIWKRHYEVQTNPLKRGFLRHQWKKMVAFEKAICRRFETVVAVSAEDRDVMQREYGISNVFDVPTGVDVEFFRPTGKIGQRPNSLVFTGSMDWLPNEDAIRYFTDQIMPIIRSQVPDITLTVVGRNPFPSLLELAERDKSIVVTGRVDDVRPFIEAASAFIVPLRIGGGTRLKIFEAMAMEKPVVSTTVGAEGLPIRDQKELLIADTPEDFAGSVIKILREEETAKGLGLAAAKLVRENFGWAAAAESFALICERTIKARGTSRAESDRLLVPLETR